jgi:hypothetical protein
MTNATAIAASIAAHPALAAPFSIIFSARPSRLESTLPKAYQNKALEQSLESTLTQNRGEGNYG